MKSTHSDAHVLQAGVGILAKQMWMSVHVKMVEHVLMESTHSDAHVFQAGVGILAKQM